MTTLTRPERLALLMNLLDDDVAALLRQGIEGEKLQEVEAALADFEQYPASTDEIDAVLDDFESYFSLAMQTVGDELQDSHEDEVEEKKEQEGQVLHVPEEQFEVEIEPTKTFEKPKLTGDTQLDLNRVHPYQVAQALKVESPSIIAVVVSKLADEHAAKTLELLPDPLRPAVFLKMAKPSSIKPMVLERILGTILDSALLVEQREEEGDASAKMATLIRSLPKAVRAPVMEELAAQDEELANEVKGQLYQFEDLGTLEDRDLQKVLGKSRTDVLVFALQQVEEELLQSVLANMSKRAKASLLEEMEFKANAKEEEIEEARAEVVKTLIELDESGAITLG